MGHWFLEAYHPDLEDAGVEHDAPLLRPPQMQCLTLPAPVHLPVAAGQIGMLRDFPTFEQLNLGQARSFQQALVPRVSRASSSSYDRLRENALGR